jgi:probable addiction module antidote protein
MTPIETYPWNPSDDLQTREDIALYLEAALEEGDTTLIVAALGDILRSPGITTISRETGLDINYFRQTLSHEKTPSVSTIIAMIQALGLHLQIVAVQS